MKPFNLKEALAGKPVVTLRGIEVTQLHLFEIISIYQLFAVVEGEVIQYTTEGKFNNKGIESGWDLFMAEEKKFLWINLWQQLHENGNYHTTVHTREDLADLEIENNVNLKHIQKLTMIL
jgi:hypothetical protein